MDWVLTKAHRDPKQKGRKNSQAAPEDFLASSSEDESPAGTSYAAHTDQTGRLNHPEASVSPQVTAAQGPPRTQVEYARTYTSRWANQMDSQAQEVEQQATASKRVVKRVDEKRRAVDKMLDQKLDERCRKIADDLLRGGSPGVVNASINFHGNQPMQVILSFEVFLTLSKGSAVNLFVEKDPYFQASFGLEQSAVHRLMAHNVAL